VLTFSFLLLAIPLFRVPADCPASSAESIRKRNRKRVGKRNCIIEPGSAADRSVTGFRLRHGNMSRSDYYRRKKEGRGPRETWYGARTVIITPKDEAEWDRQRARPDATEQRLLAKLQKKRTEKARKAAAASVASRNHVSKQKKQKRTRAEAHT
jgi:hypothetical protein